MLKRLDISGFKSFAKKTSLDFSSSVTAIVGPNGSGKSNVAEAFRFALGEQSMKSMRGKRSEDLIFSGSHSSPRSNRASVAIVFDNSKKQFKIDFEEIVIERAVFRDGSSEYSINGSRARLRDIQELLAGANIGETGHHIISQGEADRILLANPRERREMLENALGLSVYELRKGESVRKLEKTEENMRQVEAMRRELTPHLKFLKTQVDRLERADSLRRELAQESGIYFTIEEKYLADEKKKAESAHHGAQEKLAELSRKLEVLEEGGADHEDLKRSEAVRRGEHDLERLIAERAALSRDLGKVEGALESAERRSVQAAHAEYAKVSREDLTALRDEVESQIERAGDDLDALRAVLGSIRSAIRAFFERYIVSNALLNDEEQTSYALKHDRERLLTKDTELAGKIEEARHTLARARDELRAGEEAGREGKHKLIELAEERARMQAEVVRQEARKEEVAALAAVLVEDRAEVFALVGEASAHFTTESVSEGERSIQETRRRTIERMKIRLEEAGGAGEDVRTEYKDSSEREAFLARELDDLAKSAAGLRTLIDDLDDELAKNFTEGLKKVNESFAEFFKLMFDGGGAKLTLEEPEPEEDEDEENGWDAEPKEKKEEGKPGIEIAVNLPRKRVQSLMQLSGGERALTSIALIFAMSQVNPPPFLILDETDAALDEANSRRYGDMIEALAHKSQLIVITHNRETMSRAGILYGVTMGGDGVSKLLSVKFDEAVVVAK